MLTNPSPSSRPLRLLEHRPSNDNGQPTWVPSWSSTKQTSEVLKTRNPESRKTEFHISPSGLRLTFRALPLKAVVVSMTMPYHGTESKDWLQQLLLRINRMQTIFRGRKTRNGQTITTHQTKFNFQSLLEYITGGVYDGNEGSAFRFSKRLWDLCSSFNSSAITNIESNDFTRLSNPITVPRLNSFFQQVTFLIVGQNFFRHVWQDVPPLDQRCGREIFIILECRCGLALRAVGGAYEYLYRVELFSFSKCGVEAREEWFRRGGQFQEITLV
jgi:hypothetical protein